jgi:NAD-dependent DNA ligase
MSEELHRFFGRARLDDRQINELIGLAHGLIADSELNDAEVEYLRKWLVANQDVSKNPVTGNLLRRIDVMLSDGVLDAIERKELFETLRKFSGGDFELGEVLKATELPLDHPPPIVICPGKMFCFTGTFAFGSRKACEAAIEERGGRCGSLTQGTNFLVVGIYATGSWKHSSYGDKIERAVKMRDKGIPISIVGEAHWVDAIRA